MILQNPLNKYLSNSSDTVLGDKEVTVSRMVSAHTELTI